MSKPTVTELGNTFHFTWAEEKVTAKVERVYQHRRGDVSAEITFSTTLVEPPSMLQHQMVTNLLGPKVRSSLAKDCWARYPQLEEKQWAAMVETCFEHVVNRSREGEPPILLVDIDLANEPDDFLLYPILYRGHITVIFGTGGSLKSTLAAWLAHRVALGMDGDGENVCILDWESSPQDWARKLHEVATGFGDPEPAPNVTYRRMYQPIADDVASIYALGNERDIGLWIIDSGMWACGGRPEEAENAMAMFRSLRSLGGTVLIIAHQNNDENTKRPYGNVMWVNAPRSVIQVQKGMFTITENEVVVGLTQRKVNYGRPFPPMGFSATFETQDEHRYTPGDSVRVAASNPLDEADLAANVSMPQRIRHFLKQGRANKDEIIVAMDAGPGKEKIIISTVDRMARGGKLVRLNDGKFGLPDGTFSDGNAVSPSNPVIPFPAHG